MICSVCKNKVLVDKYGNGKCNVCGWKQNIDCLNYPDAINPPNFVTLNNAKILFAEKKPFLPSYEDVIELVNRGLDVSFEFNKKKYLLDFHDKYTLWEIGTENYIEYNSKKELTENLSIDNVLVKDIWDKIKRFEYGY